VEDIVRFYNIRLRI